MTDDIKATVLSVLIDVVPGADPAELEPSTNFRDQIDMDSIDFMNLAMSLHDRLGVDIPEVDYPKLSSLDGCVAYLRAKIAEQTSA